MATNNLAYSRASTDPSEGSPSRVAIMYDNPVYPEHVSLPNEIYDQLDTITESGYDLDLKSDSSLPQNTDRVLDMSNRKLTTELAAICLPDVVRKLQPRIVILDNNRFNRLPEVICEPCVEVLSVKSQVNLDMSWQEHWPAMKDIPESIGKMTNLKELSLANNAVAYLPESIQALRHLAILDMRLNYLRTFPKAVTASRSLREVNLTGNYIAELPAEICNMSQLEILVMDNNDLAALPEDLHCLQKLRTLSVRTNKLSSLPRRLHQCPALVDVTVEGNSMEYPPDKTCRKGTKAILEYLKRKSETQDHVVTEDNYTTDTGQILIVRDQQLHSLDEVLAKKANPKLDCLDARDNQITTLPGSLPEFKYLQTLNLANNQIVEFPLKTLRHLKLLKKLDLSKQHDANHRSLSTFPVLIGNMNNIQELILIGNNIDTFPSGICAMSSLRILDLEGNRLKSVPAIISGLTKLEYLGLTNNELSALPESIGDLKSLKVLRLSKNHLTELPDSICELINMQTLSLKRNRLTRLPALFFKLKKLLVHDKFKTSSACFSNGCHLDKNSDIQYPPYKTVKEGIEHVMEYLEFAKNHPEILGGSQKTPEQLGIQTPPTPRHSLGDSFLLEVSKNLGPEWFFLGLGLGIPHSTMDSIRHNNRFNIAQQSIDMLACWRNAQEVEAPTQKRQLVEGLRKIHRNDLAGMVDSMPLP